MIEIIKEGRQELIDPKYKAECRKCKCVFTFNHSDIEVLNRDISINNQHIGSITCPFCGEKIYIYESNRVKD